MHISIESHKSHRPRRRRGIKKNPLVSLKNKGADSITTRRIGKAYATTWNNSYKHVRCANTQNLHKWGCACRKNLRTTIPSAIHKSTHIQPFENPIRLCQLDGEYHWISLSLDLRRRRRFLAFSFDDTSTHFLYSRSWFAHVNSLYL